MRLPVILFIAALLTVLTHGMGLPAAAAQGISPARQTLEVSVSRVLALIKNPDYVNPATREPLLQKIEDEVLHVFDFDEFSSRTVGPRWAQFNADQQKRFADAFADLLIATYVRKIDGYNGEQIAYMAEISQGDKIQVETVVTMKDGKKIPVAYRMLEKNGKWRVYDVLVESVSLVKNYRTQFQGILTGSSPDELITRVKAKAQEARNPHAK